MMATHHPDKCRAMSNLYLLTSCFMIVVGDKAAELHKALARITIVSLNVGDEYKVVKALWITV